MGTKKRSKHAAKVMAPAPSGKGTLSNAVHVTRLQNMRMLIDARFKGNATAFAKAIERSHAYVWQLQNEYRALGEDMARHIEHVLKLPEGYLDRDDGAALSREIRTVLTGTAEPRMFFMVPERPLDQLDKVSFKKAAATSTLRPCPVPCSDRAFYFILMTGALEPALRKYEQVFVDPAKLNGLIDRAVYVVQTKEKPRTAVLRVAARRERTFLFVTLNKNEQEKTYDQREVEVVARVISRAQEVDVVAIE